MKRCPICQKKIWFWQDWLVDDRDSKLSNDEQREYHTRCVLWNNRRGVKESYPITHCHTRLENDQMCSNVPIYTIMTLPQCENCFKRGLENFDDLNPIIRKGFEEEGDKVSR